MHTIVDSIVVRVERVERVVTIVKIEIVEIVIVVTMLHPNNECIYKKAYKIG